MGDLSGEPSMEDILSSIKRIIAEESDSTPGRTKRPERTVPRRSEPDAPEREEILELRDPADTPPVAVPPMMPRPAPPALSSERTASSPAPETDQDPAMAGPIPRPATADAILSKHTAAATRGPLDTLSRLIVKPEVAGSDTLEAMVREMLRPMLREWLDANLPHMVEAMVAREIDRITGK